MRADRPRARLAGVAVLGLVLPVLGLASPAGTEAAFSATTTAGTLVWTPSAVVYDRAGNRSTTTAVAETGTADRDF